MTRVAYICDQHGAHHTICCDGAKRAFPETRYGAGGALDQAPEGLTIHTEDCDAPMGAPCTCPEAVKEYSTPDSILQILERAQETVREREARYGNDGYLQLGAIMSVLFPYGIKFHNAEQMARYYLLEKIVEKLCRYVRSYADGGHQDSIHDLGVYAFKMEEHDSRNRHGR